MSRPHIVDRPRDVPPSRWRRPLPELEVLLNRFSYDPEVGELRNRPGGGPGVEPGKLRPHSATVEGYNFATSRIVWKIMTGEDPPFIVDHQDGDHSNNSWSNLRPATYSENSQNKSHVVSRSKTGHRGVYEHNRKNKPYEAVIYHQTVRISLGCYDIMSEAIESRALGEAKYYGKFRTDRVVV